MRVIGFLLRLIVLIIKLPFFLIDLLLIELPKEYIASRWRKRAKVGDRAYFINLLGTKSVGTITKFYSDGEVRLERTNSSGSHNLRSLYPAKKDDY